MAAPAVSYAAPAPVAMPMQMQAPMTAMPMQGMPAMTMTAMPAPMSYAQPATTMTAMPMTGMPMGGAPMGGSLFDVLDRNHDGRITKSEFAAVGYWAHDGSINCVLMYLLCQFLRQLASWGHFIVFL
jgi:hypothetical protein